MVGFASDAGDVTVSGPSIAAVLDAVDRVYPTDAQLEALMAPHALRLLPWGNRSGKTTVGGIETVLAACGRHPWYAYPAPPLDTWIVGITNGELDKTVRKTLEGDFAHPRLLPQGTTWHEQKRYYQFPNGSRTYLISEEAGYETIQGAAIPLIWIDEEISEKFFDELLFRSLGANYKPRILYTMTALKGFTYPYHRYFKPWEELRRRGKASREVFVSVRAIYDNPHLDRQAIEVVSGLSDNILKRARLWGGFVDATQSPVFAIEAIEHMMQHHVRPPIAVGELDARMRFHHRANGRLQVWEWPSAAYTYVCGGDYGEGVGEGPHDDKPDYTVFPGYNRNTRRQAWLWRSNTTEPIPATNHVYRCSRFWNNAYFVGERNGPGFTGLRHLYNRLRYGNIYFRRVEGRGDRPMSKDLGYLTEGQSRDLLVNELRNAVRQLNLVCSAKEVVEEMAHAVYKPTPKGTKLRAEAQEGFHDDCWIGTGLALFGFSETARGKAPAKEPEPWSWNWLDRQIAAEQAAAKGSSVWQ